MLNVCCFVVINWVSSGATRPFNSDSFSRSATVSSRETFLNLAYWFSEMSRTFGKHQLFDKGLCTNFESFFLSRGSSSRNFCFAGLKTCFGTFCLFIAFDFRSTLTSYGFLLRRPPNYFRIGDSCLGRLLCITMHKVLKLFDFVVFSQLIVASRLAWKRSANLSIFSYLPSKLINVVVIEFRSSATPLVIFFLNFVWLLLLVSCWRASRIYPGDTFTANLGLYWRIYFFFLAWWSPRASVGDF